MTDNKPPTRLPEWLVLGFLLLVLVPVELLCAEVAYETLGEIDSSLYWFVVVAGNFIAVLLAIKSRFFAAVAALLLALAIIPYQAILVRRLWQVQTEAARIVGYVYETRLHSGQYPANLEDYTYHAPSTRQYFQSYHTNSESGGFMLVYRIGTGSTSHWYSPKDGWSYYPD